MKLLRILIILLFFASPFCFYPQQPAQAALTCPDGIGGDGLIAVTYYWQDYALRYFDAKAQQYPGLASIFYLHSEGTMEAIYTAEGGYWLMDSGAKYFASDQSYPFLLQYYFGANGKIRGASTCQVLIGVSSEYPKLGFAYVFRDYFEQLNDGDTAVHPDRALYFELKYLTRWLGEPK